MITAKQAVAIGLAAAAANEELDLILLGLGPEIEAAAECGERTHLCNEKNSFTYVDVDIADSKPATPTPVMLKLVAKLTELGYKTEYVYGEITVPMGAIGDERTQKYSVLISW